MGPLYQAVSQKSGNKCSSAEKATGRVASRQQQSHWLSGIWLTGSITLLRIITNSLPSSQDILPTAESKRCSQFNAASTIAHSSQHLHCKMTQPRRIQSADFWHRMPHCKGHPGTTVIFKQNYTNSQKLTSGKAILNNQQFETEWKKTANIRTTFNTQYII